MFAAVAAVCALYTLILLAQHPRAYIVLTVAYAVFFFKVPLIPVPGTHVAVRGEDLLIALLAIRLLLDTVGGRGVPLSRPAKRLGKWSLAYFAVLGAALASGILHGYVEQPSLGLLFVIRKVEYFSLFFAGYYYFSTPRQERAFVRLLDLAVPALFAIALLQRTGAVGAYYAGTYVSNVSSLERAMSTFSGAYEWGGFLVLIVPLYIWRVFNEKMSPALLINSLLILASMALTQSRSSMLALVIVIPASIVFARRGLNRGIPTLLVATSAILPALTALLLLMPGLLSSFITRFQTVALGSMWDESVTAFHARNFRWALEFGPTLYSEGADLSFSMRVAKWFNYINGVESHPLLGLGPSVTGEAVDGNYIRVLAESGILGFILWLAMLVSIARVCRALSRHGTASGTAVLGALIGMLVGALFIDIFEASKIAYLFWFMVGWAYRDAAGIEASEQVDYLPDTIGIEGLNNATRRVG